MKQEFIEKIYAGWLAKIIGIRLGAAVEGWTYEDIKNVFGELHHYPTTYKNFAADDDSNGPLFYLRAIEDSGKGHHIDPQDVAEALLNYAPYEHGFFWWGGYGVSTEHTAYLNIRNGIKAPDSGSAKQNGYAIAEQIGGQIFVDSWGLVCPGNPDKAANFAKVAASVTHDRNGIYGGMFVAACIAYAFVEDDIVKIIEKGLSYIPKDCEYAKVVNEVMHFYDQSKNWRECYNFLHDNFGYDKYPGTCHIIPNAGVMILSLLYGEGQFDNTLNICNMCGWDTDCNVGNIATILGVLCGLDAIDYHKWRKPINDLLICSSVVGSLNIQDVSYGAAYIAKLAYAHDNQKPPEPWNSIFTEKIHGCHFEYPGSTHAMRVRKEEKTGSNQQLEYHIVNTDETAASGNRSLKVTAKPLDAGECMYVYQQSYYIPDDFSDSRYDPSFSPTVYPGQTINGSAFIPEYGQGDLKVQLYVRNSRNGEIICGEQVHLKPEQWNNLNFTIPFIENALIDEFGFCIVLVGAQGEVGRRGVTVSLLVDDLYVTGEPDYNISFAAERVEVWNVFHREISQMTRLKGLLFLENQQLNLSCDDFGEAYTGSYNWQDYKAEFTFTPVKGENHLVNVRVQGGIRSYAVALLPNNKVALIKNQNGYTLLKSSDFTWEAGKEYTITVKVKGNQISWKVEDVEDCYTDTDNPYLYGSVGIGVQSGSRISCREIKVCRNK